MALALELFGTPRLLRDGEPVALNLRRGLALLAYLAATERAHERLLLAALLWPEAGEGEGRSRLRRTVYRINRAAGAVLIEAGGEALWLAREVADHCDLIAYRAGVSAVLAPGVAAPSADPVPVAATAALCRVDSHIAYQAFGDGRLDLVLVPGFVFHLEHIWTEPALAALRYSAGEAPALDRRTGGGMGRAGGDRTVCPERSR